MQNYASRSNAEGQSVGERMNVFVVKFLSYNCIIFGITAMFIKVRS